MSVSRVALLSNLGARRRLASRLSIVGALLFAGAVASCGGGNKEAVTAKTAASVSAEQIDADPVALLPGAPIAAARVDARAILGTSYGEALGRIVDKSIPVGEEAGFLPSRDIETIWAASYGGQGADGVAVLRGKFDDQKLASAAEKKTQTKGGVVVKSSYAERNVYTVANVGIVVLTSKTALVGTEAAVRRVLDRVRDGRLQRSVPSWMIDTLSTTGAAVAAAGDFETQPMPPEIKSQIPVGWLRNVKTAKLTGTPEAGMRVKAHLSYPTAEEAQAAERGFRQAHTLASALAITGAVPKMQDTEVKAEATDLDVSFRVDERGLSSLISQLRRWLPN